MSSDDGDDEVRGGYTAGNLSGESRSANDIEGSHTKKFLGVEYILGFKDFSDDGDGGVDGVGDDEDECIGTG